MTTTLTTSYEQFRKAQEPTSDGGATITVKEAKAIMLPLVKDDSALAFKEARHAYDLRDQFTKLPVASGVLKYTDNFIKKFNGLSRVVAGMSDYDRAVLVDEAVPYHTSPDLTRCKEVKLTDVPQPARAGLATAKKAVQDGLKDVQVENAKNLQPGDVDESTIDPVRVFEVYKSATDKTVVGYAANGWFHDPGWDLGMTFGVSIDGKKLYLNDSWE